MKNIILIVLCFLLCVPAFAQRNIEAFPGRDMKSSLQILPNIGGWKYNGTALITVDSASIDSTTWYYDYTIFDTSYYRTNIQILMSMTGGAAAGYPAMFAYYKVINYAGTASVDSFWINDMVPKGWSNNKVYCISLAPAPLMGKGIRIFIVNTGIATVTCTCELYTSEIAEYPNWFEFYSITDTINGDTASGVFIWQNTKGLADLFFTLDSINCASDSFKFEARPAWTYSGGADDDPWITFDSLNWRDWSEGYQRTESLTGIFPPTPFWEWRAYSGMAAGDTLGINLKSGGYRK